MSGIHDTLERLNAEDRQRFITMRMTMRRAYLMCIQSSVGMNRYCAEDDTFMDAIDLKIEMLATRSGMNTLTTVNNEPRENGNDPFAMLTRIPAPLADKKEVDLPQLQRTANEQS